VASVSIRIADLPGMRAFFEAVGTLLDAVNAAQVPPSVTAAADQVRAEALGIGNDPAVVLDTGGGEAPGAGNTDRVRAAMRVARANPGTAVSVDWLRESGLSRWPETPACRRP